VNLAWYEPSRDGRHHTLEVCLRYRGVTLLPTTHGAVMTDGKSWLREYFLLGDELVLDYRTYLRRTLLPFSRAGVHVIAVGPRAGMSAEAFAAESEVVMRQLVALRHAERG